MFVQVFSAVVPCVLKLNRARIISVSVKRKSEFLAVVPDPRLNITFLLFKVLIVGDCPLFWMSLVF